MTSKILKSVDFTLRKNLNILRTKQFFSNKKLTNYKSRATLWPKNSFVAKVIFKNVFLLVETIWNKKTQKEALKNVYETMCNKWSLYSIKSESPRLHVFIGILLSFYKHLFYKTPLHDCLCKGFSCNSAFFVLLLNVYLSWTN